MIRFADMGKTELQLLEDDSVVSFTLNESKTLIVIEEHCDLWYKRTYTKEGFGKLIDELKQLHDSMK